MKENTIHVRIPQLRSVEGAVRLYYERGELTNGDIKDLFDVHSSATITKLKNLARAKMAEENKFYELAKEIANVNTAAAYSAWGLDISNLEQRLKKLRELRELAV